jgi:hypothetical protein
MITENDIKTLKRHETRMGTIAYWMLIFAPIFLVVIGCLNLWLASKIGNSNGQSLSYLFQSWIEGINVNQQYSGLYLKALERLETALFQFGLALIFIILSYGYHRRRKMEIRILEALRQTGLLTA